jgi:hypothetical protein
MGYPQTPELVAPSDLGALDPFTTAAWAHAEPWPGGHG